MICFSVIFMRFVHVNGYASNLFTHCCCYTALCCMNAPQVNDPFYYGCAFRLFPVVCFVVVVVVVVFAMIMLYYGI